MGNNDDFCQQFQDIRRKNGRNLDLDLKNWSRSNVYMAIESSYITYYFIAVVTVTLCVTISMLFTVEMRMTLILIFNIGQSQT